MTNLELIKSFDADSMACMLVHICYEVEEKLLRSLAEQLFDATLIRCPEVQVEIHKKWLLEEAESEDTE